MISLFFPHLYSSLAVIACQNYVFYINKNEIQNEFTLNIYIYYKPLPFYAGKETA